MLYQLHTGLHMVQQKNTFIYYNQIHRKNDGFDKFSITCSKRVEKKNAGVIYKIKLKKKKKQILGIILY